MTDWAGSTEDSVTCSSNEKDVNSSDKELGELHVS